MSDTRYLAQIAHAIEDLRDEVRLLRKALESKPAEESEPDGIACPHCGNSDPDRLESIATYGAPDQWFCKNVACAKSFRVQEVA